MRRVSKRRIQIKKIVAEKIFQDAKKFYDNGKYIDAIRIYQKVLRNDQMHNEARIHISDCYINVGNFKEAYKRIIYPFLNEDFQKKLSKKNKKDLLIKALEICEKIEDIDSQISILDKLTEIDKKIDYRLKKIDLYIKKNQFNAAIIEYYYFTKKERNDPNILINYGKILKEIGNFSESERIYKDIIKMHDNNSKIKNNSFNLLINSYIGLGKIYNDWYKTNSDILLLNKSSENAIKAVELAQSSDNLDHKNNTLYDAALILSETTKIITAISYLDEILKNNNEFLDAHSLRARLILKYIRTDYHNPFKFRTAAEDLYKIATLRPNEKNINYAYSVISSINDISWKIKGEKLKKKLEKIQLLKKRRRVFVAEILDDIEENKRKEFWEYLKTRMFTNDIEVEENCIRTIKNIERDIEYKFQRDLKNRGEISEEEVKYLYLLQVLNLAIGNPERAIELEDHLFRYADQEHFILIDSFSYMGKFDDIIQDENNKRAKIAFNNQKEYKVTKQISYKDFKSLKLDQIEIRKLFNFLEGKGGTKYLSKKTPELNIIKPKRTMKVKLEKYERNPQAIERTNITRD